MHLIGCPQGQVVAHTTVWFKIALFKATRTMARCASTFAACFHLLRAFASHLMSHCGMCSWEAVEGHVPATDPAYQQIISASGDFSEASDTQSFCGIDVCSHHNNQPLCSAHEKKN